MPTQKFKIVWTGGLNTAYEVVEFTCADPLLAIKAYVEAITRSTSSTADVFPVVDEPKPLFSTKTATKVGKSKLFDDYTESVATGPKHDKFLTPDSTWISHVTWEAFNSSIGIHFLRGGYVIYESDYATFCNFKTWVEIGNSAGAYYNSNVKGLEVLKSK